jgi:uncharacterized cofD-like protein
MKPRMRVPKAASAQGDSPLRVVAVGGGNGLSTLLRGLRAFATASAPWAPPTLDITAVVTVTDDGGSSGRLRREFAVLPPGDIRNCMVAMSGDEALLSRLFQYRFPTGHGLKGHSFGNLFLTALSNVTGDFAQAVKVSSEVLAIAGRIYPSTAANVALEATLADDATVIGETRISRSRVRIQKIALRPRRCRPLRETLEAIARADLITLGPGSLFTSVIPNLLVQGIPQAIRRSPAIKAYVANLMWQPGETVGFSASDHVRAVLDHSCADLLDCVVVNTQPIAGALQRKYARLSAQPVANDVDRLRAMGLTVIEADLVEQKEKVRHDPVALAGIVLELAAEGRQRRQQSHRRRRAKPAS